jgi:UDP:flavonoid glycosyltransferase YjiC (YdhE family)
MKFALASHGTRGDIEPCAAVGLELRRRGHDVVMAVPANLVEFAEQTGLAAVAYGPDFVELMDPALFRNSWRIQNPVALLRKAMEPVTRGWANTNSVLMSITGGADLLLTGIPYQEVAANVAEHRGIPLAALHTFPQRVNGYVVPIPPLPLTVPSPPRVITASRPSRRACRAKSVACRRCVVSNTCSSMAEDRARMMMSRVRGVVVVAFGLTIRIARTTPAYVV